MDPHEGPKYPQPPPPYSDVPPVHGHYPGNPPYPPPPGPIYPTQSPPGPVYPTQPLPSMTGQQVQTITVITPSRTLGSKSEFVTCPHCSQQAWTRVETRPNWMTHTCALILCCFVLWPIAWLPYCCDACQAAHHYCGGCNAYIGEGTPL